MISNFTKGRRGHYSEKIIDSILEESLNKPWTAPVSVDTFVLFHGLLRFTPPIRLMTCSNVRLTRIADITRHINKRCLYAIHQ